MRNLFAPVLIAVFVASGCAVNPVTGERNLNFMSADWEQSTGEQMYAPMRQAQGGDFILDPELTAYVRGVGQSLAVHAKRSMDYEFNILNDSVPNAWALPGGKITINRGLLTELDSEAELAAVLGHEIVHADAAHGARAQSRGVLTQVGSVAAAIALGSQVESQQAQQLGMLGIQLGAALTTTKYGRDAERESDEFGMQYMSDAGYDPQGAVDLQETFLRLSEGRNSDWLSGLFASHPPSQERVENNRQTAATLPQGGRLGREEYRQKIALLNRLEPAYSAHDEARKALSEGDTRKARQLIDKAISLEPREARFFGVSGDIYAETKQPRRAEVEYTKALDRDDGFFYYHLQRGLIRQDLGQQSKARQDLEKSLKLLPTSQANLALGNIKKANGNVKAAISHYQAAAQSESPAATTAHGELARIDPGSYLQAGAILDERGNAYAVVVNNAPINMAQVTVLVEYINAQGQLQRATRDFNGVAAQKQTSLSLGISGFASQADFTQRLRVSIASARAQ